jgi:microcystin-dependent protein
MCWRITIKTLMILTINFFLVNLVQGQSVKTEHQIKFENWNDKSKYIILSAPATVISNTTYTLPQSDGTDGQVLKTDGAGALSWTTTSAIPVGSMMMWPAATPPSGWLICNGQAVGRDTCSVLYTLISTTYGSGDGSTTFNLPDLRSRFPLGVSGSHALASNGGEETHQLDTTEIPGHNHLLISSTSIADQNVPSATRYLATASPSTEKIYRAATTNYLNLNPGSISTTGSGAPHNNMPPYITINFIIKY